jgi:hypothetical protein
MSNYPSSFLYNNNNMYKIVLSFEDKNDSSVPTEENDKNLR